VDDLNQEVYKPIDDFLPPLPAKRRDQRVANRLRMSSQFPWRLSGGSETIPLKDLRRNRLKQGVRQMERCDALKLADFLEDALQARATRVCSKLRERSGLGDAVVSRVMRCLGQLVHRTATWSRKALVRRREEIRLVRIESRSDHPIDSRRSRRFNPVPATPVENGFLKVLRLVIDGQDLSSEPSHELFGIVERSWAEAKEGADLGPVPLTAPTAEVIFGESISEEAELIGQVIQDRRGHLLTAAGKPAFDLNELEQDGKAHPAPVGPVSEQFALVVGQRPVLDEFLLIPMPFHDTLPVVSASGEQGDRTKGHSREDNHP
jgi:hypothetical protein